MGTHQHPTRIDITMRFRFKNRLKQHFRLLLLPWIDRTLEAPSSFDPQYAGGIGLGLIGNGRRAPWCRGRELLGYWVENVPWKSDPRFFRSSRLG